MHNVVWILVVCFITPGLFSAYFPSPARLNYLVLFPVRSMRNLVRLWLQKQSYGYVQLLLLCEQSLIFVFCCIHLFYSLAEITINMGKIFTRKSFIFTPSFYQQQKQTAFHALGQCKFVFCWLLIGVKFVIRAQVASIPLLLSFSPIC